MAMAMVRRLALSGCLADVSDERLAIVAAVIGNGLHAMQRLTVASLLVVWFGVLSLLSLGAVLGFWLEDVSMVLWAAILVAFVTTATRWVEWRASVT